MPHSKRKPYKIVFLYIVEGPAGSGKSTIIQERMQDWPGITFIEGRVDKTIRNYKGPSGLVQATIKDMNTLAQVMTNPTNPDATKEMVLIDRWLLSSLVYDALRGEAPLPQQNEFNQIIIAWLSMIMSVKRGLEYRGRWYPPAIQINWMFNIPDEFTITSRRRHTGKIYPFAAESERVVYESVYHLMANWIDKFGTTLPDALEMHMQDITEGNWEW